MRLANVLGQSLGQVGKQGRFKTKIKSMLLIITEQETTRKHFENTVSRKCEYGVLEITHDFQNPILTFPHSQH